MCWFWYNQEFLLFYVHLSGKWWKPLDLDCSYSAYSLTPPLIQTQLELSHRIIFFYICKILSTLPSYNIYVIEDVFKGANIVVISITNEGSKWRRVGENSASFGWAIIFLFFVNFEFTGILCICLSADIIIFLKCSFCGCRRFFC